MSSRLVAVFTLLLGTAILAPAQQTGVYSKAVPPDKAVLDRLNLKTEWVQYLPVEGTRDTLTQIQTIDDQVFVQTRAGVFIAIDALTGRIQWVARLGNGYANSYPCAANSQFVFVAHVTKLYAFYRYTGATEFVAEMGTPPTTGLACDDTGVFCVLGMRPGSAGAHRVAVYNVPPPITVSDPVKAATDLLSQSAKASATGPVDDLLKRYKSDAIPRDEPNYFEPAFRPRVLETPVAGTTGSKTPSVSTLPSVVPPYSLGNRAPTPSLSPVASMRQPYRLRLESGKYIQQTPSIGVIPPSVAASLILADLRPRGIEPKLRWEYGLTSRILYPIHLTPTRAWVVAEGNVVIALNKNSEAGRAVTEVKDRLSTPIPAPPAASGLTHFIPLGNGTLVAIDASSGNLTGGITVKWRADTGGINNHTPFVTKDFVYASGDDSGVICVERGEGNVIWKSESSADRIIGANEEFVYVRDRQGRFLVFDAKRASDAQRQKSAPLGTANISEFNIHVVNTASDRVYLAADNGLIVCLRDAAPKYAKPMQIWPPPIVNPPKKISVELQPEKNGAPPPPKKKEVEPKKEPEPKKD